MQEQAMARQYQVIVANPPWVVAQSLASFTQIENAVYDPKEAFLISTFKFAGNLQIYTVI